jgi:hypothetical protein
MALLLYATSGNPADAEGRAFLELLNAIEGRFECSLILPISELPPLDTAPSPNRDWLSLPRGSRTAVKLRLLRNYAAWFRPAASVFHGSDATVYYRACIGDFGQRMACTTEAPADPGSHFPSEATATLLDALAAVLPFEWMLCEGFDAQRVRRSVQQRSAAPRAEVYCRGAFSASARRDLEVVLAEFSGPVTVHLRLEQALMAEPRIVRTLLGLERKHDRVRFRIDAEGSSGVALAVALNTLWRARRGLG